MEWAPLIPKNLIRDIWSVNEPQKDRLEPIDLQSGSMLYRTYQDLEGLPD